MIGGILLVCFVWFYFYLHCYEGITFIICFKYLLWQLELQAIKTVLHQVTITVLQIPFPNLVSTSSGLFPSFYSEEIGTHLCKRKKEKLQGFSVPSSGKKRYMFQSAKLTIVMNVIERLTKIVLPSLQ